MTIKRSLEKGANVNVSNEQDDTPLDILLDNLNLKMFNMIELLIKHGYNPYPSGLIVNMTGHYRRLSL